MGWCVRMVGLLGWIGGSCDGMLVVRSDGIVRNHEGLLCRIQFN